jgi:hypothetical protein
MDKSIISGPAMKVHAPLVEAFGLNQAIFLQQVHYWTSIYVNRKDKRHYHDGRWWIWNTYKDWQKQFTWVSIITIKRVVYDLSDKGVLITTQRGQQRRLWYAIDYDRLGDFLEDGIEIHAPWYQNDTMEADDGIKMIRSSIREMIPSTLSENTKEYVRGSTSKGEDIIRMLFGSH